MPKSLGRIPTLPGLTLSSVQARGKVIYTNGHARPRVTNGQYLTPIGLKALRNAPEASAQADAEGTMQGKWLVFLQLYSGARSVPSNLSPAKEVDCGSEDGKKLSIHIESYVGKDENENILADAVAALADRINIWIGPEDGQIRHIDTVAIANIEPTYDVINDDIWQAQAGIEDRVTDNVGDPDRWVTLGNDIFPTVKYVAYHKGRLWGFGQENYGHPGALLLTKHGAILDSEWKHPHGNLARVVLIPFLMEGCDYGYSLPGVFWADGPDGLHAAIVVTPGRQDLLFLIHGRVVARITNDGTIYLRGTATEQGEMVPPDRSEEISWDPQRQAILVNAYCEAYGNERNGGMVIDEAGNLTFDCKTTIKRSADWGESKALTTDPINWYLIEADGKIVISFLPRLVPSGISANIAYIFNPLPLGIPEAEFRVKTAIVENATDAQLMEGPKFDEGLLYKSLYVGPDMEFLGFVYDVTSPTELWLNQDFKGGIGTTGSNVFTKWEFVGLPFLFYTAYGKIEGGHYGDSLMQEGAGTYFYYEFEPGEQGLTPAGLSVGSYGLEVIFREGEYFLRIGDTETPIQQFEITKRSARTTTIAPKSIVRDRQNNRLSVVMRPKGIAISSGGEDRIITDEIGARKALLEGVDQLSLSKACAAFFTNDVGDYYVVGGLTKSHPLVQNIHHTLVLDLRGEIHVTEHLDGLQATALMTLLRDTGDERVVYGDVYGNIGYIFDGVMDQGKAQFWEVGILFSPFDLMPVTITALRCFAGWPRPMLVNIPGTEYPQMPVIPYGEIAIGCDIYELPASIESFDLMGYKGRYPIGSIIAPGFGIGHGYPMSRVFFRASDGTINGMRPVVPIKNVTAPAFAIMIWGQQESKVTFRGLEIDFTSIGEGVGAPEGRR